MADTKITEMVAGTLSADDLFTFVDDPTGTPVNKKIAYSTIESGLSITESQISDLGTYATTAYVDAAVVGLYDHKGAYNASTNSPDLDTSPSGILKGDAYTVSVAGTFFTAAVDAGDVLIADQDSPTLESHWTIVNRNIDETAFAASSHAHAASDITSGTLTHERGGLEADISAIAIGDVIAGTGAGTLGIVTSTGHSDGDVLTIQADGTVDFETPSGGGVTDHGALTGLADDDHTQYALANGQRWTTTPTASRAIVSDGSGYLVVSAVTATELGYVSGVTSSIQTQIDAKAGSSHAHAASDITSGTLTDARIAASNVTQHQAAISITESQISDFGTYSTVGHAHAASDITSGTLTHERGGLEADISAYGGVPLIDGGSTSELKYNLTATADPVAGDDSVDGYTIGSRWVNVTLDKEFVCLDASVGAAVWTQTSNACCSGSGSEDFKTLADGATVTIDQYRGDDFVVTLAGNRTLALTNPTKGQSVMLRVIQDATGSRTLSYPASVKWPGGTAPTLTTTASRTDWIGFKCIDASTPVYHGFVVGQDYA